MTRSRVKVTITIQTENELGELTGSERWDIITSAIVAVRAAIERYIKPADQRLAIDACSTIMKAPLARSVKHTERKTTMEIDK
jgi:hypothetical protein